MRSLSLSLSLTHTHTHIHTHNIYIYIYVSNHVLVGWTERESERLWQRKLIGGRLRQTILPSLAELTANCIVHIFRNYIPPHSVPRLSAVSSVFCSILPDEHLTLNWSGVNFCFLGHSKTGKFLLSDSLFVELLWILLSQISKSCLLLF